MNNINKYGVPISNTTDDRAQTIQPKFKNRFRVFFYDFGSPNLTLSNLGTQGAVVTSNESVTLTSNVISFNKPQVNFQQSELRSFIGKGGMQGRGSWENFSISVRDDIRNAGLKFITRQVYLQQMKYVPHSSVFGRNFTFSVALEIMDGRTNHTPIERWIFTGCQISTCNFGDLSYDNMSDYQRIDISISMNSIFVDSPARIDLASNQQYNEQNSVTSRANSLLGNSTPIPNASNILGGGGNTDLSFLDNAINTTSNVANNLFGKPISTVSRYAKNGIDYASGLFKG